MFQGSLILSSHLITKKEEDDVRGIKIQYLESKALSFANNKEHESCLDCLGLLFFGIILFLWTLNYIDPAAISVFQGAKALNADPTPALLTDIYYTLHTRYEKGRVL